MIRVTPTFCVCEHLRLHPMIDGSMKITRTVITDQIYEMSSRRAFLGFLMCRTFSLTGVVIDLLLLLMSEGYNEIRITAYIGDS